MTAKLRKRPGTDADQGLYELSGSLAGLTGPGRRRVVELELRNLDGDDLSVLGEFEDLEVLRIERSRNLDLRSLPSRPGLVLALDTVQGFDLGALDGREDLLGFWLIDPRDCLLPTRLRLPSRLRDLVLIFRAPSVDPTFVVRLLEAIDWDHLEELRALDIGVDGDRLIPVDLGFVGRLPSLERLDMLGVLRHGGRGPSPLRPPFSGLSRKLTWLRIEDADDAYALEAGLRRHLGVPLDSEHPVSVAPTHDWEPGVPMWRIARTGYGWESSGSFAIDASRPVVEEDTARGDAVRRLAEIDPRLARRLEFSRSWYGSSVVAPTREDLDSAFARLGLIEGAPSDHVPADAFAPPAGSEWEIAELEPGQWGVYGSFVELFDGRAGDEEFEAMREARERVRQADRALERRLDFDHESDATGVYAGSRDDLEAMLALLGIRGGPASDEDETDRA